MRFIGDSRSLLERDIEVLVSGKNNFEEFVFAYHARQFASDFKHDMFLFGSLAPNGAEVASAVTGINYYYINSIIRSDRSDITSMRAKRRLRL